MNKFSTLALSVAVTASLLATPLASQEIIVSPSSHAVFVNTVQADLDRQLQKTRFASPWGNTGATSVRFTAGTDGRPDDVRTYRKSGSPHVDRAARRAVSRLTSLSPLPRGAKNGQVIQANIIFAGSEKQAERLQRKMERQEADRIASSPAEREILALTVGGKTVS